MPIYDLNKKMMLVLMVCLFRPSEGDNSALGASGGVRQFREVSDLEMKDWVRNVKRLQRIEKNRFLQKRKDERKAEKRLSLNQKKTRRRN